MNLPRVIIRPFLRLLEAAQWYVFRLFEELSEWRSPSPTGSISPPPLGNPTKSLWVFASTIGELNAIEPFMRKLLEAHPGLRLVILSDHEHYRDLYLSLYPHAHFFFTLGASRDAALLCRLLPPSMLVIAEIPCLPSDAPCRFSFAFVRAAKHHDAQTAIVNGWLYGQEPACRLDALEHRLLLKSYLRLMDIACLQTNAVADHMIKLGLDPNKVEVTGNMKFDNLHKAGELPLRPRSPVMINGLVDSKRNIIVVGCLRKQPEQQMAIEAFFRVKRLFPDTLLILAHRHPKVEHNLTQLELDLNRYHISHARRTDIGDTCLDDTLECLVLDTLGELKSFYATTTVAHVAADHNLLEPLAFEKPVTTVGEWQRRFPNYPIFELLAASGGIVVADTSEHLAATWCNWLNGPDGFGEQRDRIRRVLDGASGATEKTCRHLCRARK